MSSTATQFKNEFKVDGIIEFIDNTKNVSTTGQEFFVRTFGIDKTEVIRGNKYPNKIKMQLKGNNCDIPDKIMHLNIPYKLSIGDHVVVEFSIEGMAQKVPAEGTEKMKLAKQNPTGFPGNPAGIDYGITNINCYDIQFANGFVPNPANALNPIAAKVETKIEDKVSSTAAATDDDLPF